ncbi:beta Hydroxy acid dehydrogenase 2 [Haematobia irritans]|uniref:beta Hydroxy acid dehydrogenase 2 n=1 Tax=Haematobia irritans TaxID=7368 RepID=UPI003F4FAC40
MKTEKIGIIGSGLIGRAWSMLFASVGYKVMLYDILPEQLSSAIEYIDLELHRLEEQGLLRGHLSAEEQFKCIKTTTNIKELTTKAIFIQECIPERIEWKKSLYQELDDILEEETIVSSSTSTFMPSLFSDGLKHRHNILVSHPLNPPYYIPLVEIVPAPWTLPKAIEITKQLMLEIKQKPVTLKREVLGFATNRIQYAILNEIWHLVDKDILTVADIDAVMTQGLGLRYAFLGPLETAHLNADGIADYVKRFGSEIHKVSETYDPIPKMEEGETLERIAKQCEEMVPKEKLSERRKERDEFLTKLVTLKKEFEK